MFDAAGAPLNGVKIVARSPTQIGGDKTVYSDADGGFRIPGLLPGAFEVTAEAAKLRKLVHKNVRVGVNAPVRMTFVMEVESAAEEVKVVDRTPMVSTTTANVVETFDEEFVEGLPLEQRWVIESFVGLNTPGASLVGGVRLIRIRGGGTEQNAINVEGFRMNGQRVAVKSLAAFEVQTAAYGAENANVAGGVVNMVSKSGSNRFEADVSGWLEDNSLRLFTDASDTEAHTRNYFINPAVSGRIIKDRLWFYFNTELRREVDARDPDPSGRQIVEDPEPFRFLSTRSTLKLTWQATPRSRFSTFSSVNREWNRNNGSDPYGREKIAQRKSDNFDHFNGVIWEWVLADNVLLRSQIGVQKFWTESGPMLCLSEPDECDHIPQIRNTMPRPLFLQNYEQHDQAITSSFEAINQIEWFARSATFGQHDMKVRSRVFGERWELAQSTPGDHWIQFSGTARDRMRTYYANDPRNEPARYGWHIRGTSALTTVHSLQDSIRLTRHLTFTPGVAYTTAHAASVGQEANLDNHAFTPHMQVAWDATHDGRTVIRGSFNQYVDTDVLRLARFGQGDRVYRDCFWNPATESYDIACSYGGGAMTRTFGLPCGPDGVNPDGTSCKEKLRLPRTWEYTAGGEREISPGLALGTDLVYRLYTYPYEDRETNRIWSPSGYALEPLWSFRNGRSQTVSDLATPAEARRRYVAVTGTLHKRDGDLKATLSYTWARLEGNVNNNEGNEFGGSPAKDDYYLFGYSPDDARHTLRGATTYRVTNWLQAGVIFRYTSGRPYRRRFRNEVTGMVDDYRATTGVDPGGNINDPGDDRMLRLPDVQELNLQLRANLQRMTGSNIEAFLDVINLLALRTTLAVDENDGPSWGTQRARMAPLRIRLGFRYRY